MSTFWIVLIVIGIIALGLGIIILIRPCKQNKKQKGKHQKQENEGVLLENLVQNQEKTDTVNQIEGKNEYRVNQISQVKQNEKKQQVSKEQQKQYQIISNQQQIQNTNIHQNNQIDYKENQAQNQTLNNYHQPNLQEFNNLLNNKDYQISLQEFKYDHGESQTNKQQQENIDNIQIQQFNYNQITEAQVSNQTQNNLNQFNQQEVIDKIEQLQINIQPNNNKNQLENSNETNETQVSNQTQIQLNLYENQQQFQVKNQSNNNENQLKQQEHSKQQHAEQFVDLDIIANQLKQQENFNLTTKAQVSNQIQYSQNEANQQQVTAEQFVVQIDEQFYKNDKKLKQEENFIQITEAQVLNQTQNSKTNQQEVQNDQYVVQIEEQLQNKDIFIEYQELGNLVLEQKIILEQIDKSIESTENQLNMKIRKNDFSNNQQVENFSKEDYLIILNNQLMKLQNIYKSSALEIEKANENIKYFEHNPKLQNEMESIQNYKQTLLKVESIHQGNQQLIEKVKELISFVQQFEFDEDFIFNPDPDVQRFINDLYDKTCRQRAVENQYRLFVRQVEDFNSLKKNYNLSLQAGKELRLNYCNQIQYVRGDGNCFYTAFGFQFLKYLLLKYNDKEFNQFLNQCEKMKMPMKLFLSENSPEITNKELETKMLIELFNRLRRLRKIDNLKERLNQLEQEFAAYQQSQDQIEQDGCLYALSTIFLRNYSNYAVDFHEMKDALFDRQNLLIWEKECNTNEIVIDALSRQLKLHSILILLENREFEVLEYQKQAENKIILLIKPGHYNIGIDEVFEENPTPGPIDSLLLIQNQIKTKIQEQLYLIQLTENSLMEPQLKRQLS